MTSDHKKPGVAFWTTVVVVVVLVAYPLSFEPACWLAQKEILPARQVAWFYRPISAAMLGCGLPTIPLLRYAIWWGGTRVVTEHLEQYGLS